MGKDGMKKIHVQIERNTEIEKSKYNEIYVDSS